MLQRLQCVMRGPAFATGVAACLVPASRLGFWRRADRALSPNARLQPGQWDFLAASARDGGLILSLDGRRIASGPASASTRAPRLPGAHRQPWDDAQHFAGRIDGLTAGATALDAALARTPPDALTRYEPASPQWPVRTRQMAGQVTPQPPATLPA